MDRRYHAYTDGGSVMDPEHRDTRGFKGNQGKRCTMDIHWISMDEDVGDVGTSIQYSSETVETVGMIGMGMVTSLG